MDIVISLVAVIASFAVGVLAWPTDRSPLSTDRYRIYGR